MGIYADVVKCPYCEYEDEQLGLGEGRSMGKVECVECGEMFRIEFDEEQQMYIMEKA